MAFSIDPASFLSRAGYTYATWAALPRGNKQLEAGTFAMQGRTMREGAQPLNTYYDEWTPGEYALRVRDGTALANQVDAYCLRMAVEAKRLAAPKFRAGPYAYTPAGQVTPPQDSWVVPVATTLIFGGLLWWAMGPKGTTTVRASFPEMRPASFVIEDNSGARLTATSFAEAQRKARALHQQTRAIAVVSPKNDPGHPAFIVYKNGAERVFATA